MQVLQIKDNFILSYQVTLFAFVAVVAVLFSLALFSSKIGGSNFKTLRNACGWGYAVCDKALHMGG